MVSDYQLPSPARQVDDGNVKVFLRQGLGCVSAGFTSFRLSRYTDYVKSMVRQAPPGGHRPKRGRPGPASGVPTRASTLVFGVILCCAGADCSAVDQVVLQVGQISTAGVQASGATITLNVARTPDSRPPILRAQIQELRLASLRTTYRDVDVTCTDLFVSKPHFECNEGTVSARGGPTGQVAMKAAGAYNSSTDAMTLKGSELKLAGGTTRFEAKLENDLWSLDLEGNGLDLESARRLLKSWIALPQSDALTGHLRLTLESTGRWDPTDPLGKLQAHVSANTTDLNYSNEPGTTVGQNLTVTVLATATRDASRRDFNNRSTSRPDIDRRDFGGRGRDAVIADIEWQTTAGQALAGAVLLDFAKNPLTLSTHAEYTGTRLNLPQIRVGQKDLLEAQGNAQLSLAPAINLTQAHFDVARLEFAAAYRSFLQLTLATTDFGALNVGGRATGQVDVADNALTRIDASLQNVSMADATARLSLANVNGEIHWSAMARGPVPGAPAQASRLSWSSSSAYGLLGGPVEMSFTAHGNDFALADDTYFPIFDGALVVHTLAIRGFGTDNTELDFDGHLEPISMPILSKAFGWPTLSGQLAGRIPGVTYRDRVLAVDGDLSANVFDGTIVGSRIKLSDPLGPWPRLNADVTARRLDLDLLTHTFSIGSISGRLDADIKGLELFNWSPVAFDAQLQTTPGDRSEHRISQRAITSISSVGGGGGGVAAALQSGILKFFDTFHYDRIGISCQLRDQVCLMSGVEPARSGYYLVKGRGLPRIDIIGNAGRVDWPQLVGQIAASMHSQNIIVR